MKTHWLDRPGASRRLWIAFAVVLAAAVLAQLAVDVVAHFAIEGWFAFYAVLGFAACAILVAIAKLLGLFLKRRDTYYEDGGA